MLRVLGKRRDGFHELDTLFQTIDLRDEIEFRIRRDPGIGLRVRGRQLESGEQNLVWRAARALQQAAAVPMGTDIVLQKRIPIRAGLGGGSANAATALMALNQLWGCGYDRATLGELAAGLGSDVAFFLVGGVAAARGRGEILDPWPDFLPTRTILLLYPGLEISSSEAYRSGDWPDWGGLTREDAATKIQRFRVATKSSGAFWAVLENDFEDPLYKLYPPLAQARDTLVEAGCSRTLLSGSGSTVIGLAPSGEIGRIHDRLQAAGSEVFSCRTLSAEDYWKELTQAGLSRLD